MKIYFATSNLGKLKEFQEKLKNTKITVEHLDIPYPEIQSDYLEEIARFGAKYLTDKINETVIVEDSGLFVSLFRWVVSIHRWPGSGESSSSSIF